jgi:hypothetical protein
MVQWIYQRKGDMETVKTRNLGLALLLAQLLLERSHWRLGEAGDRAV